MQFFWYIIELDIHRPRLYRLLRASFAIFLMVYVFLSIVITDEIIKEQHEIEARSQTYANEQDRYIFDSVYRVEKKLDDLIRALI